MQRDVQKFGTRNPQERVIRVDRSDDALINWQGTRAICRVQWERWH